MRACFFTRLLWFRLRWFLLACSSRLDCEGPCILLSFYVWRPWYNEAGKHNILQCSSSSPSIAYQAIRPCTQTRTLTSSCPACRFRDNAVYRGRQVFLYKRAQIFVADVYGAFGGRGLGSFRDIDQLTMFADYRVPVVLRKYHVLEYSAALQSQVRTHLCSSPATPLDVRILEKRACHGWSITLNMATNTHPAQLWADQHKARCHTALTLTLSVHHASAAVWPDHNSAALRQSLDPAPCECPSVAPVRSPHATPAPKRHSCSSSTEISWQSKGFHTRVAMDCACKTNWHTVALIRAMYPAWLVCAALLSLLLISGADQGGGGVGARLHGGDRDPRGHHSGCGTPAGGNCRQARRCCVPNGCSTGLVALGAGRADPLYRWGTPPDADH